MNVQKQCELRRAERERLAEIEPLPMLVGDGRRWARGPHGAATNDRTTLPSVTGAGLSAAPATELGSSLSLASSPPKGDCTTCLPIPRSAGTT